MGRSTSPSLLPIQGPAATYAGELPDTEIRAARSVARFFAKILCQITGQFRVVLRRMSSELHAPCRRFRASVSWIADPRRLMRCHNDEAHHPVPGREP